MFGTVYYIVFYEQKTYVFDSQYYTYPSLIRSKQSSRRKSIYLFIVCWSIFTVWKSKKCILLLDVGFQKVDDRPREICLLKAHLTLIREKTKRKVEESNLPSKEQLLVNYSTGKFLLVHHYKATSLSFCLSTPFSLPVSYGLFLYLSVDDYISLCIFVAAQVYKDTLNARLCTRVCKRIGSLFQLLYVMPI